jgi:FdhD protein
MRTPGHDRELCYGLLLSLGIIESTKDILAIKPCMRTRLTDKHHETLVVDLAYDREYQPLNFLSGHPRYSGCGVCGSHEVPISSRINRPLAVNVITDASALLALPEKIARHQRIFLHTGGCHAAALFDVDNSLFALFEDIGRHNALDKLVGHTLLSCHDVKASTLVFTSRASFEIVQKAHRAGISVVVAMGAVSSLAVDEAERSGITLVGFLRGDRFSVYTYPHRVRGM